MKGTNMATPTGKRLKRALSFDYRALHGNISIIWTLMSRHVTWRAPLRVRPPVGAVFMITCYAYNVREHLPQIRAYRILRGRE